MLVQGTMGRLSLAAASSLRRRIVHGTISSHASQEGPLHGRNVSHRTRTFVSLVDTARHHYGARRSHDHAWNPSLQQRRGIWSSGQAPPAKASHPLDSLTAEEIRVASTAVKKLMNVGNLRFIAITLLEPPKNISSPIRSAEVVVLNPGTGIATELTVVLNTSEVSKCKHLPPGVQPMFTPEDCDLAESIAKNSPVLKKALKERYGIEDMARIAADPWSVSLADENDKNLTISPNPTDPPRRLVQTFLYQRVQGTDLEDNHYAHPIDLVPVVDLNTQTLVRMDGLERLPAPTIPQLSVNYHRDLVKTNSYLQTEWRQDRLKALDITQPDGPSFKILEQNLVEWQNWTFRVGFNYREGLVLHDVRYQGRQVMNRGSLVEMAVPYGDPNYPYQRKCAFDVGDYGLGNCANSLELGCDCLGHIHYFDAHLNTVQGEPRLLKKAICMHEEDNGLLWKHVEYRNGHSEARRARELVISSIATVVNYEYCFYWRLKLDGSIDFEIRLTGELSTNQTSAGEDPHSPSHGVLVAPGVNSQVHQHMFSCRLDMAVDGTKNTVSEIDIVPEPLSDKNPYGNAFGAQETVLMTEKDGVRSCDATKARTWKISNAEGQVNPITGQPTAYKLIPFTRGPAQPVLLTHPDACAVSQKGAFAQAHLWVTRHNDHERYPAGGYTPQAQPPFNDGIATWIEANRCIHAQDIVLWHSFGVTHVPRVEDFPVMPCESTGFTLKPDGFFAGNPAMDVAPEISQTSQLNQVCCS
jgi:primary-amine oxidase